MKSGVPWEVTGVRQRARETAREAARRAGMSVGEWLDTVILDRARDQPTEPRGEAAPLQPASDTEQRQPETDGLERPRYSDYDERHRRVPDETLAEVKERLETLGREFEQRKPRVSDDSLFDIKRRLDALNREFEQRQARFGEAGLTAVNDRLDTLTHQLDQLTQASTQIAQITARKSTEGESDRIADVLSQLDRRLDQMSTETRSHAGATGRRAAEPIEYQVNREPAQPAGDIVPATPLEQALAEIAERQRTLDGETALPRADLPRAPTQGFGDLELQLRSINERIETMRPCGIHGAVETLRDDLAEIGLMIKEAMPRQAIEALEGEVRSLSDRIGGHQHTAADFPAIEGVERALAEVRNALQALMPAEHLVGFDEALQAISQKIDGIAAHDPAAIGQLEGAITELRGVVSHVASNDALAALSEDVRGLSARFEHVATPDILSALEQRIAIIADALEAGHHGGQEARDLEGVVLGLSEKLERLQLTPHGQPVASHIEDQIARIVEKLDSSDARLTHLDAIERGLAELLARVEHQQMAPPTAHLDAPEAPEVDALKRDMRRTQDSIEAVHGTLGHLIDRLAMIETGIRGVNAAGLPGSTETDRASERRPLSDFDFPPDTRIEADADELPLAPVALNEPTPALTPVPATSLGNPPQATKRDPIDPDLPPDHPLEPGSNRGRGASPADRIAASEAALGPAKPPVIPDPAGKSNFIAAARRAAQAAGGTDPATRAAKPDPIRASKPDAKPGLGSHVRSFLVAASVVAIVLGSLQLVSSLFFNKSEAPDATEDVQSTQSAATSVPVKSDRATPPPADTTETPERNPSVPDRQSALLPGGVSFLPSGAGIVLPGVTQAAGNTDATADVTGSVRPASQTAKPVTPPNETVQPPRGADKLPAAIGGSGLRAAAAKGEPTAEFEVATRFAEGRGVPQDLTAAAEWFERAANHGLAPAQFRIGGLYEKGTGVKKDLEAARRFYLAAAQAGHAKAMHNLAVLYAEGIDGKADYQTAAKWFRKAAGHGVTDSQYNLAILYARGIGVETNLPEAYKWFALAAREGDKDSAKKRDDVGARLDQTTLMTARAAAQVWVPEPQPEAAVQVRTPAGGWDAVAAPSTPKRRIGPEAKGASLTSPQ